MMVFVKAHPVLQGASRASTPVELNDRNERRSPGEPSREQAKSGRYNKPRITWRGLTIAIENPAGSVRRGRGWEQRMRFDYGEIIGTRGADGDPVDVFVGPNPDAPVVYIVRARKKGRWNEFDEDKCMVGFDSEDDARAAFLACYSDPRFLGPITAMPAEEFVDKVRATRTKPAVIKAYVSGHSRRLPSGKVIFVKPYTDRRTKRAKDHSGQLALFVKPKTERKPPLPEDKARNPEEHTIDMFTGKTRREEARAGAPDETRSKLEGARAESSTELPKRFIRLSDAAASALEIEVLDRAHDDLLDDESEGFRLLRKHTRDGRLYIPDDPAQIEAMASELTELANKADAIAEDKSHDAESRKHARADRTAMTALAIKLRRLAR